MSDNLELVRMASEAFTGGNVEEALEFLDPDVELYPPRQDPVTGVFRGHDGAREWLGRWMEAWEEFDFEIEELIDAGKQVVVIYHQRGVGRGSGIELENRLAAVATVRDGRIVRGELYLDIAEALEVAGVRR